jgi:hypothetical protein
MRNDALDSYSLRENVSNTCLHTLLNFCFLLCETCLRLVCTTNRPDYCCDVAIQISDRLPTYLACLWTHLRMSLVFEELKFMCLFWYRSLKARERVAE